MRKGGGRASVSQRRKSWLTAEPSDRVKTWMLATVLVTLVGGTVGTWGYFRFQHWRLLRRVRTTYVMAACTVLSAEMTTGFHTHGKGRKTHDHAFFEPLVRYRYRALGQEFESTRFSPNPREEHERAAMQAIIARYEVGTPCSCWYDPAHPEDAFLERE